MINTRTAGVVYVYYAKPIGGPAWQEEIAVEFETRLNTDQLDRLKAALAKHGKEYVREFVWRGEAPDFAGAIQI